jgi:PLP dependent protein
MLANLENLKMKDNLNKVREQIASASRNSNRNPEEVCLIAVSKTHPISTLQEAIKIGVSVFGENKIQEAEAKVAELGRENLEWHLIGHLQANKARKAAKTFDVIHTLDSLELATRLERICIEEKISQLRVFIQVDLAGESTKSGISESELPNLIEYLATCKCLQLIGFMIIPPYFEDVELVRPYFKKLRELRDKLLPTGGLSMGMSHDFEVAIEEGATHIRVGTAIFGERNYA